MSFLLGLGLRSTCLVDKRIWIHIMRLYSCRVVLHWHGLQMVKYVVPKIMNFITRVELHKVSLYVDANQKHMITVTTKWKKIGMKVLMVWFTNFSKVTNFILY